MRFTSGQVVVALYVGLFVLLPTLSHLANGQTMWSIYRYTPPDFWAVMVILGLSLCALSPLMQMRVARLAPPRTFKQMRMLEHTLRRSLPVSSVVILLLVLALYDTNSASFRYTAGGVSAGGLRLILVLALKSCAMVLLLWLVMIYLRQGGQMTLSQRLATGCLTAVLMITLGGTADTLRTAFFVVFAVWPGFFIALVFRNTTAPLLTWRTLLPTLAPILAVLFMALALTIGESIKEQGTIGINPDGVRFSAGWFFTRIVDGISSHYYALVQFLDGSALAYLTFYDAPMSYPLNAAEYRFHQLIGTAGNERPDVQSLSRLNYEVNSWRLHPNEGTSPGVFASFIYVLPLWVGLAAALVYLRLVVHVLNRFFAHPGTRLSLFGGIFVLINLLFLFESPLDFVVVFDNAVVAAAVLLGLSLLPKPPQPEVEMPRA